MEVFKNVTSFFLIKFFAHTSLLFASDESIGEPCGDLVALLLMTVQSEGCFYRHLTNVLRLSNLLLILIFCIIQTGSEAAYISVEEKYCLI